MRTETEIKEESKKTRYELAKKESKFTGAFLGGYYLALRWVLGKADSAFFEYPKKE